MTLHDRITAARRQLADAGLSAATASIDADVLARHVLGWDRAQLVTRSREPAPEDFGERYQRLIDRRARREPVAFLTGSREFWGLDFMVSPDTLVPRPETELVVEEALRALPAGRSTLLDVGTGSGCLAVSLAVERPSALVVATDLSYPALLVAAANARRHGVGGRVHLVCADLASGLRMQADVIVSNPPYVADRDAPAMLPDVVNYEPAMALFGGPDGMTLTTRLMATVPPLLAPGGVLIIEFGCGQEDAVRDAAEREGWQVRRIVPDLQGIARTAVLETTRG
jgi:release factor glutamine methyltransferase